MKNSIQSIIDMLITANTGIPIVFGIIKIIRDYFHKSTPQAESLTDAQLIDLMDARFAANGVAADTEIARLRGLQA